MDNHYGYQPAPTTGDPDDGTSQAEERVLDEEEQMRADYEREQREDRDHQLKMHDGHLRSIALERACEKAVDGKSVLPMAREFYSFLTGNEPEGCVAPLRAV